ncbi:hypothetical protein SESBI_31843 [Sesbania bispinosa]|nr:hypothetical protein SESBI_31843 [Sesbania bispinosa]
MGFFYHDEEAQNHPKRCKFLVATLKEVFSRCQFFSGRLSTSSLKKEYEYPMSDFDEEQEVFISAVISQAMENKKYKPSVLRHSFSWVYSPVTKELYFTTTQAVSPQERWRVIKNRTKEKNFILLKAVSHAVRVL